MDRTMSRIPFIRGDDHFVNIIDWNENMASVNPIHMIVWILIVQAHFASISTEDDLDFLATETESSTSTSTTRPSTNIPISTSSSSAESTSSSTSTSTISTTTSIITSTLFPVIRTRKTTVHLVPRDSHTSGPIGTTTQAIGPVGPMITATSTPAVITSTENGTIVTTTKSIGPQFELSLKACCGNQCTTYDNLMSMVGLQCCGETPMNAFEKICCNGQIHLRHAGAKYFDRCCGDRPYAWDQVCCRGKVYDGVPQASCCGDVPYSIYDRSSICCGEALHKIPPGTGSAVCCGESMYDDRAGTHFCCGDRLYSRMTHNGCCHPYPGIGIEYPIMTSSVNPAPILNQRNAAPPPNVLRISVNQRPHQQSERNIQRQAEGYNSTTQMCCDRVYDRNEFDFCCYVADVNAKQWTPPVPRPYSSKTHCCDGMTVLEMDPKTKTCIK